MHDPRLEWEQQVISGLAAHGVSITSLPTGALASAFIEGATAEQFVEWATTTDCSTAKPAAPDAAPARPNPMFAPVRPPEFAPSSVAASRSEQVAGKPVKPAATLVTVGVGVHFLGAGIAGIGEGMGILFGGEAYVMLGGLVSITGLVLALIGVHRFLAAHDRQHWASA